MILVSGFSLAGFGALLSGQVYSCIVNPAGCPLSPTDVTTRLGIALPLLVFGGFMIIIGAIFTAAGHISEQIRPMTLSKEETKEEQSKQPLRVCVKCGRQVDISASYCPSCGNQLTKP